MAADNRTVRRRLFTLLCNRFDLEDCAPSVSCLGSAMTACGARGRPPPGVVHADDIAGCVFASYEQVDRAYAQSLAGELRGDVFPLLIDVQYADVRTGRLPAPGFYARLDRAQPLSLARSLRSFGQIAIQCRQIHQARVVLCSQRLCRKNIL